MENGVEGGGHRGSPVPSRHLQAAPSPAARPAAITGGMEREEEEEEEEGGVRPSPSWSPLVAALGGGKFLVSVFFFGRERGLLIFRAGLAEVDQWNKVKMTWRRGGPIKKKFR